MTFPASFDVSSLNGANGFSITGVASSQLGMLGQSVAAIDINGDGKQDLIVGGCACTPGGQNGAGAAYVVFGASSFPSILNVGRLNGTNGFTINGIPNSNLGQSVAAAGDVNGDGKQDLVVGAWGSSLVARACGSNSVAGAAYVVFGASSFPSALDVSTLNGANGFAINAVGVQDQLGASVAAAGDINGDGKQDLVVGAPNANGGVGAAYVVFGASRFPSMLNVSELNGANGFTINGADGSAIGSSVAGTGDINGDGKQDLVVGAEYANNGGAAYVVFGASRFGSALNVSALNGANGFTINGVESSGFLGCSSAGAGDINGDGKQDLVVGAYQAGAAYVVFGASSFPSALNVSALNGANGFTINGVGSYLGWSVAGAGDINGDGRQDLVAGAVYANDGAAYVVFGASNFPSALNIRELNGANGFTINGADPQGELGSSVAAAGDINGDGKQDLVVGAVWASSYAGAAYVIYGL